MAELPIERKTGTNWLPIIIGAVVILALLGWCATRNTATETTPAVSDTTAMNSVPSATTATTTGTGALAEYVSYIAARDTAQETEGNHQYTSGGIRHLAAALEAMAGGAGRDSAMGAGAAGGAAVGGTAGTGAAVNITTYADSMRSSVDRLQQSATTDVHADDVKAAFSAAVSAMEQIDRASSRTRDVASMRAIYNELDSKQPLLPQMSTVQRFFEAARDALQSMSTAG